MTDKEVRELKRRFSPEKCNISRIVGAFVNSAGQVISTISQSLGIADSTVSERLLSVMKKTLSGSVGTSLHQMEFSTAQVSSSEEHKLLSELRNSGLSDTGALERFYARVAETVKMESNYVILLANDVYDVMTRREDGGEAESSQVFSYIVCSICPVKEAPEALTFREADSLFHAAGSAGILASPELGFTFPAFDGRSTNIYGALYYTRSRSSSYGDFTNVIFGCPPPMPPTVQKETFNGDLCDVLSEECTLSAVKAMHCAVADMIEAHKESRDPEPLLLTKYNMKELLEGCGVEGDTADKFCEAMDTSFGRGAALTPRNVISTNKFELTMPQIKISVDPDYRDHVTAKTVGGESYLMIKVTGPVELNGIGINLEDGIKTEE